MRKKSVGQVSIKLCLLLVFAVMYIFNGSILGLIAGAATEETVKFYDAVSSPMSRVSKADINWDNQGKAQEYDCEFKEKGGIYGLSKSLTCAGYGEARVEVRRFDSAPWAGDCVMPVANFDDLKTMYLQYYVSDPSAIASIDVGFGMHREGFSGKIVYSFQSSVLVANTWSVVKLDMTNKTAASGTSCIENTLIAAEGGTTINKMSIHINFSGANTSATSKVDFVLDEIYLSTGAADISLPAEPIAPEIDATAVKTRYDVYGEIADLNGITASTRKPNTEVVLELAVTNPDNEAVNLNDAT